MTQHFYPSDDKLATLELASPFAYQLWLQHTARIGQFIDEFALEEMLDDVTINHLLSRYSGDDELSLMASLRILRQNLMVRWIWQDALGYITVPELTYQLSLFADGCLMAAYRFAYARITKRAGYPYLGNTKKTKDEFMMIAMGKLGAKELNLSSDIDLIFVHCGEGQTWDGDKCWDNQKFMLSLARLIIRMIGEVTADGFVFRVDMRLRPWGEDGALVVTMPALQNYLKKHGRTWERFAWLKARVVGKVSDEFFSQFCQARRQFVFRYYVDYSPFSALREMKTLITNQVVQRQDIDNIKLGAGGIRDIEFIAQSFALIYGGRHLVLGQHTDCLTALEQLGCLKLLDQQTTKKLQKSYLFLRRLEHAIQARHDGQTQRLPTGLEFVALARTLGFDDSDALQHALNQHRNDVITPFNQLVMQRDYNPVKAGKFSLEDELFALSQQLSGEDFTHLTQFLQSKLVMELPKNAHARLMQAYPVILHALGQFVGQDNKKIYETIQRLLCVLEVISKRSIYLVMLSENPGATTDLIPLLAHSAWIASELTKYPMLLDTVLQKHYRHLPDKDELTHILAQSLLSVGFDDEEGFLSAIRLFKKTQVVAVAASDILDDKPIMKVSDSLTLIAEVVLEACLVRAYRHLSSKHGHPLAISGERLSDDCMGVAIIGYGKLGGIELGYGSDLDLVFLHRLQEQGETDGDIPISGLKFATRLVQKLLATCTTTTVDGRVYEIDIRLRPSGNAGVMVISCLGFLNYQKSKAWVWEHQALVRARAICGDRQVLDQFDDIRRTVLCQERCTTQLKKQIIEMRGKMHQAHKSPTGQFHLKKDTGGLIDIEFIAQYGVLNYAHHYPQLTTYSDNVRIFQGIESLGIWDQQTCQTLCSGYLLLRKAAHKQTLTKQRCVVEDAQWQHLRQKICNIWDFFLTLTP